MTPEELASDERHWKQPLVIDFIQGEEWDDEKRRNVTVIRGHAWARDIRDSDGRFLLAIGSQVRDGRRWYYLLGDDFPEDKRVKYAEAPGYIQLAKHLMRQFGYRGDARIEWEADGNIGRLSGSSQIITVP